MDNKVIITPSAPGDIIELKDNLRAEDTAECQAGGNTPFNALLNGYVWSDECYSAKIKNKTEAMFGVSSYKQPNGYGVIWYLGSDATFKHPVTMVKQGMLYVDKWLKEKYTVLHNIADARNITHIKWLKHIGFTFTDPVMVNGYKFLQFYKKRI